MCAAGNAGTSANRKGRQSVYGGGRQRRWRGQAIKWYFGITDLICMKERKKIPNLRKRAKAQKTSEGEKSKLGDWKRGILWLEGRLNSTLQTKHKAGSSWLCQAEHVKVRLRHIPHPPKPSAKPSCTNIDTSQRNPRSRQKYPCRTPNERESPQNGSNPVR